jgi:hypothetical protein
VKKIFEKENEGVSLELMIVSKHDLAYAGSHAANFSNYTLTPVMMRNH